jgi:hypothetical protein
MKKTYTILLLLLTGVLFITATAPNQRPPEKDDFKSKYVVTDWEKDLYLESCHGTLWDHREAYLILRAQVLTESNGFKRAKEEKNGRIISWGYAQNSIATARDYAKAKGVKLPTTYRGLINWLYDNSIELLCWRTRIYYRKYQDFGIVISMHNLGERGYFNVFGKSSKPTKYWVSVGKTRKRLPAEYKNLL